MKSPVNTDSLIRTLRPSRRIGIEWIRLRSTLRQDSARSPAKGCPNWKIALTSALSHFLTRSRWTGMPFNKSRRWTGKSSKVCQGKPQTEPTGQVKEDLNKISSLSTALITLQETKSKEITSPSHHFIWFQMPNTLGDTAISKQAKCTDRSLWVQTNTRHRNCDIESGMSGCRTNNC